VGNVSGNLTFRGPTKNVTVVSEAIGGVMTIISSIDVKPCKIQEGQVNVSVVGQFEF
jgi:hypothetical protein